MKLFIIKKLGELEYKVFTPLAWFTILSLMFIAFYGLHTNDWSLEDKYYLECNNVDGCENEYFNSLQCPNSPYEYTPLCTQKSLNYGESIGDKPNFFIRNSMLLTVLIVGGFLFFNTILFNKGFFKKLSVGDKLE